MPPKKLPLGQPFATRSLFDREVVVPGPPPVIEQPPAIQQECSPAKLTLFWRVLASRAQHTERLSEWDKLACIAMVMVGTSGANERTLSYMNYVTEQRPSLPTHQEVVVCMAEQTVFGLLDFPLEEARLEWLEVASHL